MRIAFFLNDFPVLSQTFILNQITGMIDAGFEVDIFAFRKNELDTMHEIILQYHLLDKVKYVSNTPHGRIARLKYFFKAVISYSFMVNFLAVVRGFNYYKFKRATSSLQLPCDVLQFDRKRSYDVMHCQFGTVATRVLNLMEVGVLSGKLVTSFRGYDATNYARANPGVYNRLFSKGDYFLPVSESLRSSIIELGCPEKKISILHSGIMMKNFLYEPKSCPENKPIEILTVARLVEKKGIGIAIRAIAKAILAGVDVRYNIIGDGILREELESLAEELGIREKVSFLGWMTHTGVMEQLNANHVLMAPSITADNGDQEGIPNVMKEAMAVGLPVIGTLHGGIPELIENKKSGFLVAEKDVSGLADAIIYLRSHPEEWGVIANIARQVIEEGFDSERVNTDLMRVYKSL